MVVYDKNMRRKTVMSLKDRLKQLVQLTAATSSAVLLNTSSLSAKENASEQKVPSSIIQVSPEKLDQRIQRGMLVNGETIAERRARFQKIKKEKGVPATLDAIQKEEISKIEISKKDENGYLFEIYEPEKRHVFESYYPTGVLQSRNSGNGEEAEGFYPDGSRKFTRTADGVETYYHPGGKKGEEKIKETPHRILESYDVLDTEGRRTEHHYDVTESSEQGYGDSGYITRDIKKVDLYNPQTQKVVGTYTLDGWGVAEGRVAQIGFVDEKGTMKTMDFPREHKIGKTNYYVKHLSLGGIKEIYRKEKEKQSAMLRKYQKSQRE